jgi:hypothetical protein
MKKLVPHGVHFKEIAYRGISLDRC